METFLEVAASELTNDFENITNEKNKAIKLKLALSFAGRSIIVALLICLYSGILVTHSPIVIAGSIIWFILELIAGRMNIKDVPKLLSLLDKFKTFNKTSTETIKIKNHELEEVKKEIESIRSRSIGSITPVLSSRLKDMEFKDGDIVTIEGRVVYQDNDEWIFEPISVQTPRMYLDETLPYGNHIE